MDYFAAAPDGLAAIRRLQVYLDGCGLDHSLLELVKLRASQLNGCAYCLDMHTKDALAAGETPQRLMALSAWHETPFYSDRERAALAWTEALTQIAGGVADDLYAQMQYVFTDKELTDLTLAVVAINGWNRLAISFRTPAGSYRARRAAGPVPAPA
ncbi:MAG TPA: carboxymuconolactone decarboxylase family protein [Devosia sp.]|nr:carboxymuconolactone decarboxylase family protein [Devosia sp.]